MEELLALSVSRLRLFEEACELVDVHLLLFELRLEQVDSPAIELLHLDGLIEDLEELVLVFEVFLKLFDPDLQVLIFQFKLCYSMVPGVGLGEEIFSRETLECALSLVREVFGGGLLLSGSFCTVPLF